MKIEIKNALEKRRENGMNSVEIELKLFTKWKTWVCWYSSDFFPLNLHEKILIHYETFVNKQREKASDKWSYWPRWDCTTSLTNECKQCGWKLGKTEMIEKIGSIVLSTIFCYVEFFFFSRFIEKINNEKIDFAEEHANALQAAFHAFFLRPEKLSRMRWN